MKVTDIDWDGLKYAVYKSTYTCKQRKSTSNRWYRMLRMYYFEGYTIREIAEKEKRSKERVRQTLESLCKRLGHPRIRELWL